MDWITRLPDRLRVSLESLLDSVEQHEETYMDAQNASVGQIWVALAYMNQRVQKLEELVNAQRKALNDLDQDVDLDQHLESNLEESLKRY